MARDSSKEAQPDLRNRYREAVGCLIFAATCTRPDISYAVSQVSQFTSNPTDALWKAVNRIHQYIKGTLALEITYSSVQKNNVLEAFSDADYAGNINDRRSTTGVFLLLNGGPIIWKSKRQTSVTPSTTESEYVSAATAAKEVIRARRLLQDLGFTQLGPTLLHCDNQSAIKQVKNPEFHQRTIHINIKYHFIRMLQEDGTVNVIYIFTNEQLADLLTKGLDRLKFNKLRNAIGMENFVGLRGCVRKDKLSKPGETSP